MTDLKDRIARAFTQSSTGNRSQALKLFTEFKEQLNSGAIRAAEKIAGVWRVNHWVKQGILLGFRLGDLIDYSVNEQFRFFDKSTYPLKQFSEADKVRQVPGGSAIRDGAYVAPGVVIMPPAYINVGAYVDTGALIDSHALVGSCAQIGENVHLSAGSQIGGVLEPVGALPVIIEDNALIGGNCGIYEGTIVSAEAIIGAGTILTGSTPIFDFTTGNILRKTATGSLIVPQNAVVVPGTRALKGAFAEEHGLSIYSPVIIKYRDEKTDAATALEESLR